MIRWKNGYAIRYKDALRDPVIIAHSPHGDLYMKDDQWNLSSTIYACLRKRTLGYYTVDWNDGFYYILLPEEVSRYENVSFKFLRDFCFGREKKQDRMKRVLFKIP